MSLIKCPECKQEVSDKAAACPKCACPITSKPKDVLGNGSPTARAISKGLKEKELQDTMLSINCFLALVAAVIMGLICKSAIIGIITFIILCIFIGRWYYKE